MFTLKLFQHAMLQTEYFFEIQFPMGPYPNYVDKQGGGGVYQMSMQLPKLMLLTYIRRGRGSKIFKILST